MLSKTRLLIDKFLYSITIREIRNRTDKTFKLYNSKIYAIGRNVLSLRDLEISFDRTIKKDLFKFLDKFD